MRPIPTAKWKGVRLVDSETVTTEVMADLAVVEVQLTLRSEGHRGKQTRKSHRGMEPSTAQVRGVEFRFKKEDTQLAEHAMPCG